MKNYLLTKTHQGRQILATFSMTAIAEFLVSILTGYTYPGIIGLAALLAAAYVLPQYLRDYRAYRALTSTRKKAWR